MKILVTGSAEFIGGYLVEELLNNGHEVVGVDNYEKYGKIKKSSDGHLKYYFTEGDARNSDLLKELIVDCDQVVALAAKVGGISYLHEFAYDILVANEQITTSTFEAAIWAFKEKRLKKINVISSLVVYENTNVFPTPEEQVGENPPPRSAYAFQKLASEYFAKSAHDQYGLPYSIIRLSNCAGIGEKKPLIDKKVESGNIKLAMNHVIPDLIKKILEGQDPLHIFGAGDQLRCYTYAGDLARGIRLCIEKPEALNQDFNLSTDEATDVLTLAKLIWERINPGKPFRYVSDASYVNDTQKRIQTTQKAKRLLGFEAKTQLSQVLDEMIPWVREQMKSGGV